MLAGLVQDVVGGFKALRSGSGDAHDGSKLFVDVYKCRSGPCFPGRPTWPEWMWKWVPDIKMSCQQLRPFAQNHLPNLVEHLTNFAELGQTG
jgi:hypothetical protein